MILSIINFTYIISLGFFLYFFCKKFKILKDEKNFDHKKIINQSSDSYMLGGCLIILYLCFFFKQIEISYICFAIAFFFIGILSDLKILNSPAKRFFLQIILSVFLIILFKIEINDTRIVFFNELLKNYYLNIFFATFCILILINGTNFIDGINLFVNFYYIIISLVVIYFINRENIIFDYTIISNMLYLLVIISVPNFFGKIFLGDSGSYVLGAIFGIILIDFANTNQNFSPYFIILLIWYPSYELLFSIIRRYKLRRKSYLPDVYHLHHLLFEFLKKNTSKKKSYVFQFYTSFIINFFNFSIILLGSFFAANTKIIICLILISIFVYNFFYFFFQKKII